MSSGQSSADVPFVSVILPVRNESRFIGNCLDSILCSDWPTDRMEVLVVDGMSTDDTADLVREFAVRDPRVRLIENPQKVQTIAMNIGIREAAGEIILRVDGHAEVLPDFVKNSVQQLKDHPDCWAVGGIVETVNETWIGRIIAAAVSCPVGVGNSRFRIGNYEGYVDTAPFPAYWSWVFDRIGGFDEELVRNEDDELNARLHEHGGKIWLSPSVRSRYFSRSTVRKLWKQYYQYGLWRIRTIQKRGSASLRYLVPMVFVSLVILATVGAILLPEARPWWAACAATYLLALLAGAVMVFRRTGLSGLLLAPLIFAVLHFSYGLGSLFGVCWFGLLGHKTASHGMSR
ncbi:MAG: glycosyltransferase family 2 protein [Planctomycetaceae bacterium]